MIFLGFYLDYHQHHDTGNNFINEKYRVLSKGVQDKHYKASISVVKSFLITPLSDTSLAYEVHEVPDSTWYRHEVGDTVRYDFIPKTYFWKRK